MTDVTPEIVAETLVETLSDVAAKLRLFSERSEGLSSEDILKFAEVIDQSARIAAISNMQREELEDKIDQYEDELEFFHGTCGQA